MKLKDITKEELETMGYDEIAYLIIEESGKKIKLLDLFKKVCKVLELPDSMVEERIADFFELLSINKKFVLLPNGYWDLSINHKQDIVIEDDDDEHETEDLSDLEDDEEEQEDVEEDDDIFYDNDLDEDDSEDDDLKDLVILDEDEMI